MSKDYIKDIINLFDFILLNFEINFDEEQRQKWSSLKLLYEEKKKEILKENKIISKTLEINKEIIEKRKSKNDE